MNSTDEASGRVKLAAPAWRPVFRLWVKKSINLIWGSLLYNIFAVIVVTPLLAKCFPELTPWEHVKGFFGGDCRTTYEDLLPYVGPGIWIAGNAFIFAWMNKNLADAMKEAGKESTSTSKSAS